MSQHIPYKYILFLHLLALVGVYFYWKSTDPRCGGMFGGLCTLDLNLYWFAILTSLAIFSGFYAFSAWVSRFRNKTPEDLGAPFFFKAGSLKFWTSFTVLIGLFTINPVVGLMLSVVFAGLFPFIQDTSTGLVVGAIVWFLPPLVTFILAIKNWKYRSISKLPILSIFISVVVIALILRMFSVG